MVSDSNGFQARLEHLEDNVKDNTVSIRKIQEIGCNPGNYRLSRMEKDIMDFKSDTKVIHKELFERTRRMELSQHGWGVGLAIIIVLAQILVKVYL